MRFLFICIFLLAQFALPAQQVMFTDKAKIYLVRHGEKEKGDNPLLTPGGNKRAGDLAHALTDKGIRRIYITNYRRTQNTADSLRIFQKIDTVHYIADTTGDDLVKKIMEHGDLGAAILIVGHSNTIPKIIQRLGLPDYPRDYIPDNEFDNLFLLQYKDGKAFLKKVKYGKPSGESGAMQ